jgi:hypothetical protein
MRGTRRSGHAAEDGGREQAAGRTGPQEHAGAENMQGQAGKLGAVAGGGGSGKQLASRVAGHWAAALGLGAPATARSRGIRGPPPLRLTG